MTELSNPIPGWKKRRNIKKHLKKRANYKKGFHNYSFLNAEKYGTITEEEMAAFKNPMYIEDRSNNTNEQINSNVSINTTEEYIQLSDAESVDDGVAKDFGGGHYELDDASIVTSNHNLVRAKWRNSTVITQEPTKNLKNAPIIKNKAIDKFKTKHPEVILRKRKAKVPSAEETNERASRLKYVCKEKNCRRLFATFDKLQSHSESFHNLVLL